MPRRIWCVVGISLSLGCTGGEPPDVGVEGVADRPVAADVQPTAGPAARRRFLPEVMRRSTRSESFAHGEHAQIDCAACHESVTGHGGHADVGCAECHRASASVTVEAMSRDQCLSCHHASEQTRSCDYCHETPATYATTQLFELEVWATPRERTLSFSHGPHANEACATCHQAMPTLSPAVSCSSCHEEHHRGDVRCASCHVVAPEGTHDLGVHQTCSGAGCHREPMIEAIVHSRPVCLVCHQAQEEHEPGGECVDCHQVSPAEHFRGSAR